MDELLAELTALESELHHPGRAFARPRLERLLHPEFHEVGRSGRRYAREVVIDFLASAAARPAVVASGHRLQPLADGWALLHYRSEEVAADGVRLNPALRCSLWARTGEGWQLYYHQGTPEAG
ncbi:DUF4440 domain-containing protein [Pseudoxanthomonas suwonensis]|uniref:DUF4440 domain-containing protein n=1 Tax=Pseudoxanthomonas suwonensis TaxID=314722 RepID=A0A0E3Z0W0_9GAMM|nr:DUF4440 domain-containing protein [Pseudoxanthomonas suwonensis]AKC86234.1 hypothetical protein WQ53_05035 [Pseudoxanthomonas suwonensis]